MIFKFLCSSCCWISLPLTVRAWHWFWGNQADFWSCALLHKFKNMFSPLQEDDDDATHDPSHTRSSSPCCHHTECLHAFNLPKETFALINATFVAVATILGTGILALPVKLSRSGLVPFSLTFTLCLFMQLATVILMVELLQRTHAEIGVRLYREQQQQGTSSTTTTSQSTFSSSSASLTLDLDSNSVELMSTTTSSSDEQEKGSSKNMDSATRAALTVVGGGGDPGDAAAAAARAPSFLSSSSSRENSIFSVTSKNGSKHENSLSLDSKKLPDLHRMGTFFIKKKWMASMFDASVVLHFCAAMISCVLFFSFSSFFFFLSSSLRDSCCGWHVFSLSLSLFFFLNVQSHAPHDVTDTILRVQKPMVIYLV